MAGLSYLRQAVFRPRSIRTSEQVLPRRRGRQSRPLAGRICGQVHNIRAMPEQALQWKNLRSIAQSSFTPIICSPVGCNLRRCCTCTILPLRIVAMRSRYGTRSNRAWPHRTLARLLPSAPCATHGTAPRHARFVLALLAPPALFRAPGAGKPHGGVQNTNKKKCKNNHDAALNEKDPAVSGVFSHRTYRSV